MQSAYIRGLGKYLPQKILTSEELEDRLGLERGWIASRTGVETRHIADSSEAVSDLAFHAAEDILRNAELDASALDMIIIATSMPDMFFPATACLVQSRLGAERAAAFDLLNACAGFIYGVSAAAAWVEAGKYKNILVIGAETLSRMLDWTDRKTCVLFGDGAGGFLISDRGEHRICGFHLGADGSKGHVLSLRGGGSRYPSTPQMIEQGLQYLYMEGGEVFRFAKVALGDAVKATVKNAGCAISNLSLVIPHQSNVRIIEEAAKILGIPSERFYINIRECGNTAAASVPLAAAMAVEEGRIKQGDLVAMVSYGAGLAWAAMVVEW
ncbi:MAG: beta-ketoacyl-ACP synthase III [bacterium]